MSVKRLLSSLVLIGIAIVAINIDWLCALVISILAGLGLYEFFTLVEKKGLKVYRYLGLIIALLIPLSVTFRFELTKRWELLFIIGVLVIIYILQLFRKDSTGAVISISVTLFGILYVSWLLSFLIKLRYLNNGGNLVASLLLITKSGDIGAYLIGTRYGKNVLIPSISPHKSQEGAAGGFLFSILAALASRIFLPFSYLHLIVIGAFLGVLGQLGDLYESLIKRDCQAKDSGNILPGMGGVLDLLDSLLFTSPAFYFYISAITR